MNESTGEQLAGDLELNRTRGFARNVPLFDTSAQENKSLADLRAEMLAQVSPHL